MRPGSSLISSAASVSAASAGDGQGVTIGMHLACVRNHAGHTRQVLHSAGICLCESAAVGQKTVCSGGGNIAEMTFETSGVARRRPRGQRGFGDGVV